MGPTEKFATELQEKYSFLDIEFTPLDGNSNFPSFTFYLTKLQVSQVAKADLKAITITSESFASLPNAPLVETTQISLTSNKLHISGSFAVIERILNQLFA